jgi:hypothetical protein
MRYQLRYNRMIGGRRPGRGRTEPSAGFEPMRTAGGSRTHYSTVEEWHVTVDTQPRVVRGPCREGHALRGPARARTGDLRPAETARYQLRYKPIVVCVRARESGSVCPAPKAGGSTSSLTPIGTSVRHAQHGRGEPGCFIMLSAVEF